MKEYSGKQFYALVTRMGGQFKTIHALAIYCIAESGAPRKIGQAMNCVANKKQYETFRELTKDCGYINGRPTIKRLSAMTAKEINRLFC